MLIDNYFQTDQSHMLFFLVRISPNVMTYWFTLLRVWRAPSFSPCLEI